MIAGARVALTAFEAGDSGTLFGWINDPALVRFNAGFRPVHEAAHRDWFAGLGRDPSRVAFAIRALPDRRLVGMVQLVDIEPVHRSAEIVIRVGDADAQGKGLGSEAIRLAVDFAWRHLALRRVTAHTFATNARALAAFEKVGFVREGEMREAVFIDGAWTGLVVLGALNPDR